MLDRIVHPPPQPLVAPCHLLTLILCPSRRKPYRNIRATPSFPVNLEPRIKEEAPQQEEWQAAKVREWNHCLPASMNGPHSETLVARELNTHKWQALLTLDTVLIGPQDCQSAPNRTQASADRLSVLITSALELPAT